MNPARGRLLTLLTLMVAVPVVALAWLGQRVIADQARLAEHQVGALLRGRLEDLDGAIARFMEGRLLEFIAAAETVPTTPRGIRTHLREARRGATVLVVDFDGRVLYPPLGAAVSADEQALLDRTASVWGNDALQSHSRATGAEAQGAADFGWYGFYHGGGLQLLAWRADLGPPARVVAMEYPRIALLSELVAWLPATVDGAAGLSAESRTVLVDANGNAVYAWGAYEPPVDAEPRASLSLSQPLGAWSLQHHAPASALPTSLSDRMAMNLWLALGAVGLALSTIAVVLYRQRIREIRLASQRVSFVNQVSHELKTPLTNIRMYAELLAHDLDIDLDDMAAAADNPPAADPVARRLGVITTESERLSRLIGNVLTFARGEQNKLSVVRRPCVLDEIVRRGLVVHAAPLAAAGIRVERRLEAPAEVALDSDACAQILENLLSNVEKYARGATRVLIQTRQTPERLFLVVEDDGPGIPAAQRERVFEPFARLSDRTSDGVAGTGIGLDIARRLARLHGGDLLLAPSSDGARFECQLPVGPSRLDGGSITPMTKGSRS